MRRISYPVSDNTRIEIYEALKPLLNGNQFVLLDVPQLEQQLLGLIWRGGKIDHPSSEHDDWANAAAGALVLAAGDAQIGPLDPALMAMNAAAPSAMASTSAAFYGGTGTTSGASALELSAFGGNDGGGSTWEGRRLGATDRRLAVHQFGHPRSEHLVVAGDFLA